MSTSFTAHQVSHCEPRHHYAFMNEFFVTEVVTGTPFSDGFVKVFIVDQLLGCVFFTTPVFLIMLTYNRYVHFTTCRQCYCTSLVVNIIDRHLFL